MSEPTRVHTELDREIHAEMIELWPWGLRGLIFRALIKLGLEATKRHGPSILGMLLSGDVELRPRGGVQKLNVSES